MLTFTKEARDFARQKGNIVHLEYLTLNSCCIPFQPAPTVRFGSPHNPQQYEEETIDGLQVFIPHHLPDVPLEIQLSTFMGIKRLIVEGWKLA